MTEEETKNFMSIITTYWFASV